MRKLIEWPYLRHSYVTFNANALKHVQGFWRHYTTLTLMHSKHEKSYLLLKAPKLYNGFGTINTQERKKNHIFIQTHTRCSLSMKLTNLLILCSIRRDRYRVKKRYKHTISLISKASHAFHIHNNNIIFKCINFKPLYQN